MSSIRRVQTERLLQDVVHTLYSSGTKPMMIDVTRRIAQYFSKYPAGRPLPMPLIDIVDGMKSDPHKYNKLLKHLMVNVDVLYEVCLRQVQDVLMLTTSMQTDLDRLEHKRKRIETRIDDFLLSQFNTDGYYYSISDNFSDLNLTNLYLTTAQVDTDAGEVVLPTVSSTTTRIPNELISNPELEVRADGSIVEYVELAPFTGALEDSLDNIVWAFEVETSEPKEVIATATVRLGNVRDPIDMSRIDIKPYGATPVQIFWETRADSSWQGFGGRIQKGTTKMVFGDSVRPVTDVRLVMRKTEPDYTENRNGTLRYKYLFGARELAFIYQVYESNARFVSAPLRLPPDYAGEVTIDAVSIDADSDVPGDAEMRFFVAPSDLTEFAPDEDGVIPSQPELSDYVWREIVPIDSNEPGDKIIRFNGAITHTKMIRENPAVGDLELAPPVDDGPVQDRNPTPSIIEGVNVYRIASIDDVPFSNSVSLLEGVNTTRIYSRNMDASVHFRDIDLQYWADVFNTEEPTLDYGRIDAGNEFFYGGDVGAVGKDVFVEAFLTAEHSWETFLAEFQKVDVRSQTWHVKVFLNGRPIGDLPPGTHKMQLPWNFKEGLNHVVLLIRIPISAGTSDPFMGAVSLFGRGHLFDYGSVHLAKWEHVDMFTMRYNESGQPRTFTIHGGELISRRPPTTNYQLKYSVDTGQGPIAVLLRAEMSRARNNPNVTPELRKYRLRFSYAEEQ